MNQLSRYWSSIFHAWPQPTHKVLQVLKQRFWPLQRSEVSTPLMLPNPDKITSRFDPSPRHQRDPLPKLAESHGLIDVLLRVLVHAYNAWREELAIGPETGGSAIGKPVERYVCEDVGEESA